MMQINIQKRLPTTDLSLRLTLQSGDFVLCHGPSGIGKTTFLRLLAGLAVPDGGEIICQDKTWFASKENIFLPPQLRSVGFVFQDYALFPHLTVKENIVFSGSKHVDRDFFNELVEVLELADFLNKKPQTLSGGEQQRVALARAIYSKPRILLLDEPFAALDTARIAKLTSYLKQVHTKLGLTTILVSHQVETLRPFADRVLALTQAGIVEQNFTANKLMGVVERKWEDMESYFLQLQVGGEQVVVQVAPHIFTAASIGGQLPVVVSLV